MKNQYIKFRASEPEKERIAGMARRSGTTISEYCRQICLTGRILAAPKLTSEEISYFKALKAHNNGFARLTNIIRNKLPGLAQAVEEYLAQSKDLYNRFF